MLTSVPSPYCLYQSSEVGGQCVVGLPDKELGRLFEEAGQVKSFVLKEIIGMEFCQSLVED